VKEALGIYERLGNAGKQGHSLLQLAWLLHDDNQLDAAKDAASRAVQLPEKGQEYLVSRSHRVLGKIYHSKGERENAIYHFEAALGIISASQWDGESFWIHHSLAMLFCDEDKFDEAHAQIEQAKSHVANDAYRLGHAITLQAWVCCEQGRLEDAASEALQALEIFDRLGALMEADHCRTLLRDIEQETKDCHTSVVSSQEQYRVSHLLIPPS
jgi:tetratricopeptide (TPR) repeat protein